MTQPTEENVIWLTREAHDRLQAELDHLRGPRRAELSARIGEARDEGDLRENGGYHAAKEEQGKAEARIRQLEDMLRRAEVGEPPTDGHTVDAGMVVKVRFVDFDEVDTFVLGSREIADTVPDDLDVYSPQSPLGSAIRGKQIGDSATYAAPDGSKVTVEVVEATPFRG
ncbi:MAG: transcription elongation factor GreA [Nocardioidaceae bacterium]|nr:transcription elongation factor GreA [Nocardioidaceae bacterium]